MRAVLFPEQFGFLLAVTEVLVRDIFAYDKWVYLTVFQHTIAIIIVIIIIRIIISTAKVLLFFEMCKGLGKKMRFYCVFL